MRSLLLLCLLALPGMAQQTWTPVPQDKFCGLNVFLGSNQIDDCETPDAQNVLTDNGGMEKRPGNVRIAQILQNYAVQMVGEFVAPSGTRYLVAHAADNNIYQSDLSAATATLLSTAAANQVVEFVTAYGKAVFQDGLGSPWTWDGVSTTTNSGMPVCLYMVFKDERIYCGNIPAESSSLVRVSSFGSINYYTVPTNLTSVPDGPNSFNFQKNDGEAITCMKDTPWGLVVGKGHSMHILKGYDNTTYYKRIIDPKIGCASNRSMQMVDGLLVWLAYDGVWGWNGAGAPQLLSKDISSLVKNIRLLFTNAGQWTVDTPGDFNAGSFTTNGPRNAWDSATYPGSIIPSSATFLDASTVTWSSGTLSAFISTGIPILHVSPIDGVTLTGNTLSISSVSYPIYNGTFETGSFKYWTCTRSIASDMCDVGTPYAINGTYGATVAAGSCLNGQAMVVRLLDGGVDIYNDQVVNGSTARLSSASLDLFALGFSTRTLKIQFESYGGSGSGGDAVLTSSTFTAISSVSWYGVAGDTGSGVCSTNNGWAKLDNIQINRYFDQSQTSATFSFTSRIFDTVLSTPLPGPLTVNMSTVVGTNIAYSVRSSSSPNNDLWSAWQTLNNSSVPTKMNTRYWQIGSTFSTSIGTTTPYLLSTQLIAISTGQYYTPVHFIGTAITTWTAFNVADSNGGHVLYYVRAGTYAFAAGGATPAWTLQGNNATISIATGSYVQARVDDTTIVLATESATVNRIAFNWQEGTPVPVASGVYDHRYFLCAQYSSTTLTNDKCMVWQRNGKWIPWSGPIPAAMGRYNNNLIVGDGSANSYVWKIMQDGVYQDDGAAINAYWVTKDYNYGKPFNQKILHEIWADAVYQSSSSLTIGYAVDYSTTYVSRTINLDAAPGFASRRIPLTKGYELGKYFRYRFSNAGLDQTFNLNIYMPYIEGKDRIAE